MGRIRIQANDSVYVIDSKISITSNNDGIQVDNDENTDKGYVYLENSTMMITTGGGYDEVLNIITIGEGSSGVVSTTDNLTESMKAIKANDIIVDGGDFVISSYEDAYNANNNIEINGGESYSLVTIAGGNIILNVSAIYTGGDGNVDVTGTLTYTGGTIVDEEGNTIDPTQELSAGKSRNH